MSTRLSRTIDAPWLQDPLARFAARLARGHTPQALLIHGPAGLGRRHFALTLAGRLLGIDWSPPIDSPAAQLGGVPHPDYWSVGVEDDSRVIKVDQIRELNRALSLTSHGGGWKVGLIWPAEMMNHNAANTLLKTLEEPAAGTTLLLVADSPGRLPATIVSRCERIRLSPPSSTVALDWLLQRHRDRAAAERALLYAAGAPLMALDVLTDRDEAGVAGVLAELGDELQQLIERAVPPTTLARAWARRDPGICLRWLYLQTAALLRRQADPANARDQSIWPLKIPGMPVNMAACSAHLEQIVEAERLKDRSLNMEVVFADLLMWWYGAAGAAR
jgi:DNA polymerase-3 subunit delta'